MVPLYACYLLKTMVTMIDTYDYGSIIFIYLHGS